MEDYLDARDYVGAIAFLEFQQKEGEGSGQALEWLAYAYYHNWEHAQVKFYTFLSFPSTA